MPQQEYGAMIAINTERNAGQTEALDFHPKIVASAIGPIGTVTEISGIQGHCWSFAARSPTGEYPVSARTARSACCRQCFDLLLDIGITSRSGN
jgi:hypothetical protein